MTAVTSGVGPGSLNTMCSKELVAGMKSGDVLMSFLWITATPPPRPSGRGSSMKVNPVGVAWFNEK